jgi:flagellar motor switch protein FliG
MSKAPLPTFNDEKLSAADKVTALLLTMSKPSADTIIKKFDNREIRLVAHAATALPSIPDEEIEALIDELYIALESSGALAGSPSGAQQLLAGVLSDDQISEILSELSGTSSERVWAKLDDVKDERIAEFIVSEQPQVAAVILSRLDVGKAAAVLEKLSGEQRSDLSRRMLVLKPIGDTAMQLIGERLGQALFGEVVVEGEAVNKHARLAAILNKLEREQIEEILASIEEMDPADAERVKGHVFTFEDIAGMEAEDRARLMDEVPSERIVMSLRGAASELAELILQGLSPRSRRIVEAELATEARVPQKSIGEARRWIAVLALSMADRQLIKLRPDPAPQPSEA